MSNTLQQHEPQTFCAGDSLWFRRCLPEMSPQAGWWLEYTLIAQDGSVAVPLFKSIANDNNPNDASHIVQVNPFAQLLDPGIYTFIGWATNGTYRHEIYQNYLVLTTNFANAEAAGDQTPFEWKMVCSLRATLLALAKHPIQESDVQRMKFVRETREKIRTELAFWEEKYQNLRNQMAVRAGQADPTNIVPVFRFGF